MRFSILIATLESRREQFERLYERLTGQIERASSSEETEIVHFRDDRQHSVGHKRNWLVAQAQGEFVAFVDDDDEVSDDYVALIVQALQAHADVDCLGITGIITFRGTRPRLFVHSLRYRRYFSKGGRYYRPPYHLNPIRRSIALRYPFEDISYSEDIDWAMRLCRDGALKKEFFIEQPIYHYYSQRLWLYQALLDHTEWIRHPLGLKLANRVRLQRFLRSVLKGG